MQSAAVRDGGFALHDLADDSVAGQIVDELRRGPLHGRELGEAGVEVRLVDGFGVQLAVEPVFEAHCADGFEVAGPGAECEAVEGVEDALIAAKQGGLIFGPHRGLSGRLGLGCLLCGTQRTGVRQSAAQDYGQRAS